MVVHKPVSVVDPLLLLSAETPLREEELTSTGFCHVGLQRQYFALQSRARELFG